MTIPDEILLALKLDPEAGLGAVWSQHADLLLSPPRSHPIVSHHEGRTPRVRRPHLCVILDARGGKGVPSLGSPSSE
jgi:hypothetical protein